VHTSPTTRMAAAVPLLGLCCLLIAGCAGKDDTKSSGGSSPGSSSASGPAISKANFDKVAVKMSEREVAEILGPPSASAQFDPKVLKDMLKGSGLGIDLEIPSDLPGLPMPKMTLQNWDDGDTLFEVVFQEGKVASKTSVTKKEKVTPENADRIKTGMSRAEVEAILGKGKVEAGAKIEGFDGAVTVWEGTDGAISVIFTNDKVAATAGWKKK
jgi:outer membrane protein assembly factor BamE (lipoprotein component of BamABCDE complex)